MLKSGAGTAVLNGQSASFGATTINGGTLQVVGAIGNVTLTSGTLSGSGTVGNVSMNGASASIAPGVIGDPTAILTAGVVTLSSAVTLAIDLNGVTANSGHDRFVTTSIDLGLAQLTVALGFAPTVGTQFTIVTGAITGQFAQGSAITVGGRAFTITYNASSVVLTAVPSIRTWSGAGLNANWTNAANWGGGVAPIAGAPIAGDSLVFPDNAARKTANVNDFAAATQFASTSVTGNGYVISGNLISLTSGIVFDPPAGTFNARPSLVTPVKLASAQTFTALGEHGGRLGPVDLGGFALALSVTTSLTMEGQLSGTGSIVKSGSGTLVLFGIGNSYTGTTQVLAGDLELRTNAALGDSTSGNGTSVSSGARLKVSNDSSHAEPLALNGGPALSGSSCSTGCAMTGPITLGADTRVDTGSETGKLTLGPIGESGGARTLTTATGTFVLTGSNTHTGGTVVGDGSTTTLLVNGTTGNVNFGQFGPGNTKTLGGTGTVGTITGTGTVAPGVGAGILNVAGNVIFSAFGIMAIEIGGTTAGMQHDRLAVTGTVDLAGASLQGVLINGFAPAIGDAFTILQSNGGIAGQFAQGSSVVFNGVTFAISYNQNSVVLTVVAPVTDLSITKNHVGDFAFGQVGATYTVTIRNVGAVEKAAGETVSVVDTPSSGLVLTAMSGTGWTCAVPTCTRSDVLPGVATYPPITVTVSVASDATTTNQVNTVTVSTASAETNTGNNTASDPTFIGNRLSVTRSGSGSGTVTSRDTQINCGSRCDHVYLAGSPVTLDAVAASGSVFTGWLGACTGSASCTVSINHPTSVSATFAVARTGKVLDIDGDTEIDALRDGLVALRFMFGVRGPTLVANAVGPGATRSDPDVIAAYLQDVLPKLDIDGNGVINALQDGLLILRSLFSLTGDALISNAIAPDATRTTATAVTGYLETLKQ